MAQAFITLRGAGFLLGEQRVFQNTTWVFRDDEHWAILGENGSGKSLLGDALRGRLPLVSGELVYHFRPPGPGLLPEDAIGHVSFDERKAGVGEAVVQSRWSSLEEDNYCAVADYLSYERVMEINPFEVRPNAKADRQAFERRQYRAFRLLQIDHFRSRTLLTLSNGERQRVELARALCRPLRLLILDEPFLGLDSRSRREFGKLLEAMMKTPLRVLLITTRAEDLPRSVTHAVEVSGCKVTRLGPLSGRGRLHAFRTCRWPRPAPLPCLKPPRRPGDTQIETASGSPPIVQLRNVTVRYDRKVILDGFNWEVRPGESWAVLGPNGSGKSTLLSLVTGDHPQAFSNQVRVFGQQRGTGHSVWELRKKIGYVSPELHLYFDDSVNCLSVVASGFSGTIGVFEEPSRRQLRAAAAALRSFDLQDSAQSPLFALSTGLQRLVLLARALVSKPRLLILDEPCQGLDTAHRKQFVARVNGLILKKQTAVIYVTHRADELPKGIRQVLRLAAPKR